MAARHQQATEGRAAPDRPDQIAIDSEDAAEVVSFMDQARDDDGVDDRSAESLPPPREDVRPEPVEPREMRTRADYEDDLPPSEEEDGRSRHRSRARDEEDDGSDRQRQPYSRRVQQRINREVALRKRAETQLAEERAARQRLERALKIQRAEAQEEEQAETSLRELDARIKAVANDLAQAKEANDTAREVQLQIQLSELQAEKARLQARIEQERAERRRRIEEMVQGTTTEPTQPQPRKHDRSAEWIRANRRWWNTARWREAREDAIVHDEAILAEIEEGTLDFEPYSDEHFEELCRRLKTDYPDLELRGIDGELFEEVSDEDDEDGRGDRMSRRYADENRNRPGVRNGANRPPMGGLGGRDGRRERSEIELARRGKVQLTEEDFNTMRIFKLDPSNPDHKKYFARERARTILTEGARGGARR